MALGRGSCPCQGDSEAKEMLTAAEGTGVTRMWCGTGSALLCLVELDLLCCKFFYFLFLQHFYLKMRGDVLNDTGRSGIGAKQPMTSKQKRQ